MINRLKSKSLRGRTEKAKEPEQVVIVLLSMGHRMVTVFSCIRNVQPQFTLQLVPQYQISKMTVGMGHQAPKAQSSDSRILTYPLCKECGKHHKGMCIADSGVCFRYGESGHKVRYYLQSGYKIHLHSLTQFGFLNQ